MAQLYDEVTVLSGGEATAGRVLSALDGAWLRRAPYRLVLSSCDPGVLAPAGADELLGLVSSLLPLGTAGIIAGVVPLNDHAVVP